MSKDYGKIGNRTILGKRRGVAALVLIAALMVLTLNASSFVANAAPDTTAPTVSSVVPANATTVVAVNSAVAAAFSETMNNSTITDATFTLTQNGSSVSGAVVYHSGVAAVFTPSSNLTYSTIYNATITTGAMDLDGNALASDYTWSFTTGTESGTESPAPPQQVYARPVAIAWAVSVYASPTAGGNTTLPSGIWICPQGALSVTAYPATGYVFSYWLFDGVNMTAANPLVIPGQVYATYHNLTAVFTTTAP